MQAKKDPARVQLIYERAIAAFPVTHYLWQAYADYLQENLKVPFIITAVYTRAVKNCPWVGSLWAGALRALELNPDLDVEQHNKLYSQALQAGLQTAEDYLAVILARLDALRHQGPDHMAALRQGFQEAAELMQVGVHHLCDRECVFSQLSQHSAMIVSYCACPMPLL